MSNLTGIIAGTVLSFDRSQGERERPEINEAENDRANNAPQCEPEDNPEHPVAVDLNRIKNRFYKRRTDFTKKLVDFFVQSLLDHLCRFLNRSFVSQCYATKNKGHNSEERNQVSHYFGNLKKSAGTDKAEDLAARSRSRLGKSHFAKIVPMSVKNLPQAIPPPPPPAVGRIPEETVAEVLDATDIVDLIGSYFPLKRSGSGFKCNCPFHNEKTPSFNVNPTYQNYKCFGCDESGNAIGFLMNYENLPFVDAVKRLAAKAGIQIIEDAYDQGGE